MSDKKKILICIDWFAPGYKAGGPIRSCENIALLLKDDYLIYVLTTDTDHGETKPYETITTNEWIHYLHHSTIQVYYAQKVSLSLRQLKHVIKSVQADYIYLNSLFSPLFVLYPLWLKWLGTIKGKVIACPRGNLYESALSIKKIKKKPFLALFRWMGIHKMIRFQATNDREKDAVEYYFPNSEIIVTDDPINAQQPALTNCKKDTGSLKCIFIARIHSIKNLLFLLHLLEQVKVTIELTIIGPIEDKAYWELCEQQIKLLPVNIITNYIGSLPNHELIHLLQKNHLYILPTKGENFGHSIFEAFLAGRPVLISDQTPWLGLQDKKIGWDLPLAHPSAFVNVLEEAASWDQEVFDEWAASVWHFAKEHIDNSNAKAKYVALFS